MKFTIASLLLSQQANAFGRPGRGRQPLTDQRTVTLSSVANWRFSTTASRGNHGSRRGRTRANQGSRVRPYRGIRAEGSPYWRARAASLLTQIITERKIYDTRSSLCSSRTSSVRSLSETCYPDKGDRLNADIYHPTRNPVLAQHRDVWEG